MDAVPTFKKAIAKNSLAAWISVALAALTVVVYWPVKNCGFTNFDDPDYVTNNPDVFNGLSWRAVGWAFTHIHACNWHPLTWISHELDCQLFGTNAAGHHFVNLALHVANALLVFGLFRMTTGATWRSAMVAALFAWHPLHVESVAWISERKDVLSTFFGLLAMWCYVRYARATTGNAQCAGSRWRDYGLAVFFFVLSLMSKPMLVTMPFVLLVIDFWPLQRWGLSRSGLRSAGRTLLREKMPFLILAAISSVVTFYAQRASGAVVNLAARSFSERLPNVVQSYANYLSKLVYPKNLCAFYFSQWEDSHIVLPTLVLIGISLLAIWTVRRRPFLAVGWLWYLGTLLPVIGLVRVGTQAMADRYTYLPSIGIFAATVWGGAEILARRSRPMVGFVCGMILFCFAATSWMQVGYWRNGLTLFERALDVGEASPLAHHNLGSELLEKVGRPREARQHFEAALELYPAYPEAHFSLGQALNLEGQFAEAERHYREAIRNKSDYAQAYYELGSLLVLKGRLDEARTNLTEALRLKPDYAPIRTRFGNLLWLQGEFREGLKQLREAVKSAPQYAEGQYHLATALAEQRNYKEAVAHFREAIQNRSNYAEALNDLAWILATEKELSEPADSVRFAQKACVVTRFENLRYLDTLAVAYAANGQTNEAIVTCQKAIDLALVEKDSALTAIFKARLEQWSGTAIKR